MEERNEEKRKVREERVRPKDEMEEEGLGGRTRYQPWRPTDNEEMKKFIFAFEIKNSKGIGVGNKWIPEMTAFTPPAAPLLKPRLPRKMNRAYALFGIVCAGIPLVGVKSYKSSLPSIDPRAHKTGSLRNARRSEPLRHFMALMIVKSRASEGKFGYW
ncbi:hypothetical protein Nepgr_027686 [Nepenthes gracilis]|uniref:Transmembrane protein n=1 Tax=Nepenthes gracilis TaxID=150966 RepID=A0AAD3Y1N0_NEPGR|nr:hypothetical protein Nepgr_027686 [Nepenthes gracilis]